MLLQLFEESTRFYQRNYFCFDHRGCRGIVATLEALRNNNLFAKLSFVYWSSTVRSLWGLLDDLQYLSDGGQPLRLMIVIH